MSLGELIFPRACAGCGTPVEVLCEHCREHLRHPPYLVARPRLLGAPVYALGSYSDIRRRIIIGMKERGNQPVREYVGAVFAAGLAYLSARGDIPREFTLFLRLPVRARRGRAGETLWPLCAIQRRSCSAWACARLFPWGSPPRISPSLTRRIGGLTCRGESAFMLPLLAPLRCLPTTSLPPALP